VAAMCLLEDEDTKYMLDICNVPPSVLGILAVDNYDDDDMYRPIYTNDSQRTLLIRPCN
jgi:hypothetical protein